MWKEIQKHSLLNGRKILTTFWYLLWKIKRLGINHFMIIQFIIAPISKRNLSGDRKRGLPFPLEQIPSYFCSLNLDRLKKFIRWSWILNSKTMSDGLKEWLIQMIR